MSRVTPDILVKRAERAGKRAHCPYSKYSVGAALLASDGKVFTGCNMENASYGLTVCAERSAFASAISHGKRKFRAIAIVAGAKRSGGNGLPYPCGACLQTMAEFCGSDFVVHLAIAGKAKEKKSFSFGRLLPKRFVLNSGKKVARGKEG